MSLRDRLLALVREPDYSPAKEFELCRRLGLKKQERSSLPHEIRRLVADAVLRRDRQGRLIAGRRPGREPKPAPAPAPVAARPVFVPTRRGPTMPPPEAVLTFAAAKPEPRKQPPAPVPAPAPAPEVRRQPKSLQRPDPRASRRPGRTTSVSAAATPAASPSAAPAAASNRSAPSRPIAPAEPPAPAPIPAIVVPPPPRPSPAPTPKLRAHELVGRIQFRLGGSAFVVREIAAGEAAEASLQIFPEDTGVALPGDRVLAREYPGRRGKRPGEKIGAVVRVLERERDTIVGELRHVRRGWAVIPDDPRLSREIKIADPARSGVVPVPKDGDKVVVKLGEWTNREQPIPGTLSARLGRTHEPRAELLGIFLKYNLSPEFPGDVEREAASLPDQVPAGEAAHRLDYRQLAVFTIDPDDAKDFDDALSYEELPGGDVRVGVHIADVSHYVRPGTALDREAQRRGNSTYLVGVVVPMLPEKLSNGLCSLVEAQDRLCKAVFLTFDAKGRLKDTSYANTIIRSRKRLTYKQAYALLFNDDLAQIRALPLPPKHQTGSTGRALRELTDTELRHLQTWIRALWKIASRLRSDRMAHGSLDLDMPETKIFVDAQGYAERLERIEHDESHQLIEEFMLAANEAVARLTRARRLASLYRVHDEPEPDRLNELRSLLATFGITVGDLTHRAELVKLLQTLRTHPQGYTLRTQLLRSLKKAAYRHTPDGHFGLHKRDYTHFTSPIRRYSDLVVHRVVEHHLAATSGQPAHAGHRVRYDLPGVERLGEHLSLTEINSTEAERDSVKVKLLEYFERELDRKPRTRFAAVITDVRSNGVFIELVESMTYGFIAAAALADDYYALNDAGNALVGRKRKRRFEVNGRLDVVVDKVDRYKRLIDFLPA